MWRCCRRLVKARVPSCPGRGKRPTSALAAVQRCVEETKLLFQLPGRAGRLFNSPGLGKGHQQPVRNLGVVVLPRQGLHTVTLESEGDCQRLAVIQPDPKTSSGRREEPHVPAESKLEEAVSLVEAIEGWEVTYQRIDALRKINNQTFFGRGKTAELKSEVRRCGEEVTGVFINTPTLTPVQHRQLEEVFGRRVFDRFGIVLHIFKERAHTKEAKLQVELAEIPYSYAKLFDRSDESGGSGGGGGMGETHSDSRKFAMKKRLRQLQEELAEIRSKRRLLREGRAKRVAMPTVAVVGYTNAGKTTLIKALSQDQAMTPKDMLFATLDSTLHGGKLPCGLPVLYVDTIGFVSDLPHELVESFAATLEDSIAADVLVHVIDGSHPQANAQRENVVRVLEQLELRPEMLEGTINVVNKVDRGLLLDGEGRDGDVMVSAINLATLPELEARIEREVLRATGQSLWSLQVPASGPQLSWLYGSDATVREVSAVEGSDGETLTVQVLLSDQTLHKFTAKFSGHQVTMTPCHNQI